MLLAVSFWHVYYVLRGTCQLREINVERNSIAPFLIHKLVPIHIYFTLCYKLLLPNIILTTTQFFLIAKFVLYISSPTMNLYGVPGPTVSCKGRTPRNMDDLTVPRVCSPASEVQRLRSEMRCQNLATFNWLSKSNATSILACSTRVLSASRR